MIAIIDYGVGNLRSVQKAVESTGFAAVVSSDADEILAADGVILPGVGAFADAIRNLRETGMEAVVYEVVNRKTPLLGICVGMQLLFTESEEDGIHRGLDLIPGRVLKLPPGQKVPQIGWNQVQLAGSSPLFEDIPDLSYFYFVHSYYCQPESPAVITGRCEYGLEFTCALQSGQIMGTQFHPEKSSGMGLRVLRNFGEMLNT